MQLSKKNILSIITLLLVFTHHLEGQDWKTSLRNELSANVGTYFQSVENTDQVIPEWASKHEFEVRYKTNFKSKVELRTLANLHEKDRRRIWLNQAFLAFNQKKFYGKIGKQIIKWGDQTGWSWMDLANVNDYYDFLRTDEEALGVWAADAKIKLKKWQFQVRVLPFRQYSRLYFNQNRWIRLPSQIPGPGDEIFSTRLDEKRKLNELKPVSIGASVQYENNDFEISLNGYSGSNDIPQRAIQLKTPDFTEKEIAYDLKLIYHRINIATLSITKLLGEFSLSSEIAFINNRRLDETQALQHDNYTGLTLSADRIFLFENPEKQLKILFQYIKSFTNNNVAYTVTDLDHVLDHAMLLDASFQFNYRWKLKMRSVFNLSNISHNINTSLEHKVSDHFKISLDTDFLYGNRQHFFGYYHDNSRFFITLKYYL